MMRLLFCNFLIVIFVINFVFVFIGVRVLDLL